MELFLQQIANGLVTGSTYAVVALGFALIFTVLRVVNFAHGEFILIGSFMAYAMLTMLGINPLYALPVVALLMYIGGTLAYYVLIPGLARSDDPETSSFLLMLYHKC